jgi:Cu2+-exporting ATPase
MLVGRWAQEHVLERNRNALLETSGADRLIARRRRGDGLEAVPAPQLAAGDELWIAPGDLVPVKGILLRRHADTSLDWITGESEVVGFEPGDTIPAGAFNSGGRGFAVAASEDFADSRLNDLLRADSGGGEEHRPTWWTRVASGYVAGVLILAAAGFLLWARTDLHKSLEVTVAILVVTCPCALGLASPLAHEMLQHALRLRGVFLRRGDLLDRALAVRKVLLDKTGTLTLGHLRLSAASTADLRAVDPALRGVLRNMVVRSNHPVSRALLVALEGLPGGGDSGAAVVAVERDGETVAERPGRGLEWRRDGRLFRLGRRDFALAPAGGRPGMRGADHDSDGATLFTADGAPIVAFRFEEAFKRDAASEIDRLRDAGYELHLLSGDAPGKVERARRALGLERDRALGGLDPRQKAEVVARLDERDTLMVGDGLNDSPSFEVAWCTATPAVDRPVLPGKADFYFLGDGISALRRTLAGARRLRRVIRDNLVVAVIYNLGAVALCLAGYVSPLVAAILMPLSSIAVVSWTVWRLSGRRLAWMS